MIENKFGVQKKQWAKWKGTPQQIFNDLYDDLQHMGPEIFLPPGAAEGLTEERWRVICWNAAWLAAHHAKHPGGSLTEVVEAA